MSMFMYLYLCIIVYTISRYYKSHLHTTRRHEVYNILLYSYVYRAEPHTLIACIFIFIFCHYFYPSGTLFASFNHRANGNRSVPPVMPLFNIILCTYLLYYIL